MFSYIVELYSLLWYNVLSCVLSLRTYSANRHPALSWTVLYSPTLSCFELSCNAQSFTLLLLYSVLYSSDENIDVDEYGADELDDADEEDAVAEHCRVPCDPLLCPLTPENLLVFKARVAPLSMATRIEDLSDWYYTALEYVLQLKELQQ